MDDATWLNELTLHITYTFITLFGTSRLADCQDSFCFESLGPVK